MKYKTVLYIYVRYHIFSLIVIHLTNTKFILLIDDIIIYIGHYFLFVEMAETDPQFKRLLLPAEETLFEQLLRFGLYVGAVFQIMCLLAIVIYQTGPADGVTALKV